MSLDWCPGIREACGYWRDAPMLQQTFEAMERNVGLAVDVGEGDMPTWRFVLRGGDDPTIKIEVSRLLYQYDRNAYAEALIAARGVSASAAEIVTEQGKSE